MKIKSFLVEKDQSKIQSKYEEIYRDATVWLYKKFDGVHSIILSEIKQYLKNARVFDVGCGAGRLAIMCAKFARHVDAFDFSKGAISIAQNIAEFTKTKNINFFVGNLGKIISTDKKYDVITMSEVIEHVSEPVLSLKQISKLLKKNGILILSCPNFNNFRGYTYMTLLKLFDLPMSLADLRQVTHTDIKNWSSETGFRLKKCIGVLYKFGWDEKGVKDMIERVPKAISDKQLKIKCHYEPFSNWMKYQIKDNRLYLNELIKNKILKKIERQVQIKFAEKRLDKKNPLWLKMKEYINEDIITDPYYSTTEPFNYQGGDTIYILEKK